MIKGFEYLGVGVQPVPIVWHGAVAGKNRRALWPVEWRAAAAEPAAAALSAFNIRPAPRLLVLCTRS